MKRKSNKGITLISLVVTIIVLIILASVSISLIFAENNSLIGNAKEGVNKTKEQIATEKINLKITNSQMNSYATSQRMPTLQELANDFCEDSEIQYVTLESKKVASLEKIDVGEATSIFTKLKEYPYEFEINSSLQLASIDGVKISKDTTNSEEYDKLKEEYDLFKKTIADAITQRGIKTYENDSKETMSKNISAIKGNLVLIAENLSGRYKQTISVSDRVNYDKLTIDNFLIVNKKLEFGSPADGENINVMTKTYDSSTGVLN